MVSADMLGNPTCFALRHLCFANRVEQRGFAVVYVTHNRDHWWTTLEVFHVFCVQHLGYFAGFRFWLDSLNLYSQFCGYRIDCRNIQVLSDVDRHAF